jgi:hypothetical protein
MRAVVIYIWLITTILPTFSQWGTIAYYQINKEYITRVLCENRDKPQLHCNGHCYLAKKLNAQKKKQDQQTSEMVQNIPVIQLFASPVSTFAFISAHFLQQQQLVFQYHLVTYQAPLSIAVPPPCA